MKLVAISETTAKEWNAFVAGWPDYELMQTYEWGTFKETLGWKAVRLAVEQDGQLVAGAQMLIKPLPLGLASIAYVPRGPLLRWEDEQVACALLSALHAAARRHRAISLKIEPAVRCSSVMQQQLQAHGFCPSSYNNQPRCSMVVDLTPDDDTILAAMHKMTRHNIRYSARQGVVIREGTDCDLDTFCRLMEHTAKRAGFPVRSPTYYRQEWATFAPLGSLKLFLAMYEGQVLAAMVPAAFGGKAAMLHNASFDTHRNLKPNQLLMWESIRWAKSQGCTLYDVWGIPDEVGEHLYQNQPPPPDQEGGLWGVYRFKRGFGGDVVYYVGAYDYIYSRPLYRLMNALMARLGSVDRLAQVGDRLSLKPDHVS
jgi:peptidoglycan pentaglycine glycine transferase (the first glycine)